MKLFAKVNSITNIVVRIINVETDFFELQNCYRDAFLVNIDNVNPQPQVGWTYSNGVFSP